MLLRRRLMVGIIGAELTRWLDRRESFAAGALAARCLLALEVDESRSVMEKERRGRDAWSVASVECLPRVRSLA